MNDNLAEMVRRENTNEQATPTQPVQEEISNEQSNVQNELVISTTNLNSWFIQNQNNFQNLSHVQIRIRGVDPDANLMISLLDPDGGVDTEGHPKRKLFMFNEANIIPVLDLPGVDMRIFNNVGFEIRHQINDLGLKCYGIKTGLIVIFCGIYNDQWIPFKKLRMKRKDTELVMPTPPSNEYFNTKLLENADTEMIQIYYKQIIKFISTIQTNQDAVNWFLDKQTTIGDINHLLQTDDVLISIFKQD